MFAAAAAAVAAAAAAAVDVDIDIDKRSGWRQALQSEWPFILLLLRGQRCSGSPQYEAEAHLLSPSPLP